MTRIAPREGPALQSVVSLLAPDARRRCLGAGHEVPYGGDDAS